MRSVAHLVGTPSASDARDRYRGTMLGVACGSTLGLHVEFWSRQEIHTRFPEGVRDIPEVEGDRPWDDDLAQTAMLAEALIEGDLDPDDLGRRLVAWEESNGRGIGILTTAVVRRLQEGTPARDAARLEWEASGRNSAGNGAVMRCAPVALRWRHDAEKLVEQAKASALITHHDPRCVWSTVATVAALAARLNDNDIELPELASALSGQGAPDEVCDYVERCAAAELSDLELDDPVARGYTLKTMGAGLWCLRQERDLESVVIEVVTAGGDTDTNGAVAGAVMGATHGLDAIPQRWLENVHDAGSLTRLADELVEAAR